MGDDPFEFEFVDLGGNKDADGVQESAEPDLPPNNREEPISNVPPPDAVPPCQHPDAAPRSSHQTDAPACCLMETACAVLDDAAKVEDCKTHQASAEDPIAFAARKSDPDVLHHEDAMGTTRTQPRSRRP